MANKRKAYTESQRTILISQVGRVCPLCGEPLYNKKKRNTFNNYEIAHIYPLNPSLEEYLLLANEERLSDDPNDEDNVIPLCLNCHEKFDKLRTVEEYRRLVEIKKQIIAQSTQEQIWVNYHIEDEIQHIIDALYNDPSIEASSSITFDIKTIDEKLDETITSLSHRKIRNNVKEYYLFIKERFASLDQSGECISLTISSQIKTYYLKQKGTGHPQQIIFDNIVNWIYAKTKPKTRDAAEILASFFVQNCEVFE